MQIMPETVGLVPAAGLAQRVAPLPCSKEIFPVGIDWSDSAKGPRPKVAAHYLLDQMRTAGVRKTYMILRAGKWDIPDYFRDGHWLNQSIAYLIMRRPFGVPYTLDQAHPFIRGNTVLFGFPDIVMYPDDIFKRLLARLHNTGSDVVLALFNAHRPEKMDMVAVGAGDRIETIRIKPRQTDLTLTWVAAVWTPVFTEFMHHHVSGLPDPGDSDRELFVGDVLQAAVDSGMTVTGTRIDNGRYLDIGTPEDLAGASRFARSSETAGDSGNGRKRQAD